MDSVEIDQLDLRTRSWRRIECKPVDRWYCGMDVGQANDSSAFCALNHRVVPEPDWIPNERAKALKQKQSERFELRFLQRLPLRMSYVDQVSRVAEWLSRPPLDKATFGLDFVSVGRPVAELFQRALRGRTVERVLTTAGNEVTRTNSEWHVPKQILVSQLESRLHTGEFRIAADLAEAGPLKDELRDFSRHVTASGRVTFDARSGSHDDMVFACCVALFLATGGRREWSQSELRI
jgi:hypothetical protein